jgi:O-antigen/teichoic acid export membrane protein
MNQTSIFSQLLSLGRDSIIYGLSIAVNNFVGLLLIPVYTRYLTPGDYGVMEVVNTTGSVLGLIIGMGLTTALLRSYFSCENEEGKRAAVSTVLVFLTVTSVLLVLALQIVAGPLSSLIFHSSEYTTYFRVVSLSIFFNTGIGIALTVLRAKSQPTKYAMASIAQFILSVILNLVFVAVLHRGVMGVLYAGLGTAVCIYALLMTNLVRQVWVRPSGQQLKTMLAFGLPLIPAQLGGLMLVMADRYILQMLSTTDQVGLYSLGYKFGMVIQGLLVSPIQLAWLPFLFETARRTNARETYRQVFTYFLLIVLFVALLISTLAKEVLMVVATPAFQDAYKVIPLVALSYVLYGCYFQLATGIYVEGKTKHMAMLIGGAAVLNVVLNFALIPEYGIMGSAVATLIGYALLPLGAYLISQRYYRVDYEWSRVIKICLAVMIIYMVSIFVGRSYSTIEAHMSATPAHVIVGVLKLLLILTYPVLLYALRFFRPEEIRIMTQLVRSAPAWVTRRFGRRRSGLPPRT